MSQEFKLTKDQRNDLAQMIINCNECEREKLKKEKEDISLCKSCHCMTKTIEGKCGKCKGVKDDAQ